MSPITAQTTVLKPWRWRKGKQCAKTISNVLLPKQMVVTTKQQRKRLHCWSKDDPSWHQVAQALFETESEDAVVLAMLQ
eukprot:4674873-Amphidinium_carterae.1